MSRRWARGTVSPSVRPAQANDGQSGTTFRCQSRPVPVHHACMELRPLMPSIVASAKLTPILLLLASNLFMTFAWYGHLRFKQVPLAGVVFASWAIAFIEYCLAVPANRY